jgi:serine protease Do
LWPRTRVMISHYCGLTSQMRIAGYWPMPTAMAHFLKRPYRNHLSGVGLELVKLCLPFGFPLAGLLATSGNFTNGIITASAGLGDDVRSFQVSAPIQPGNSGGALLDQSGNVVGVVDSKLNALRVANITKDLAQNVNFAIKASIAIDFLEAHNVSVETIANTQVLAPADIAERAGAFTVYIECN